VDDDILAQQHFLRAHTAERGKSETGLIVVRADSNQLLGKRENWALDTLLKRASKPNKKITVAS
jgi:hypothetical protein